jgi:hypothetical protein
MRSTVETSDAVWLSSCWARLLGGGGEGDRFVVVLASDQAVVETAEQAAEQVALGGVLTDLAGPVAVGLLLSGRDG